MSTNDLFKELSIDSQEFKDQCALIASAIANGENQILKAIEDLQPFLTNSIKEERLKGTLILSTILKDVPKINEPELEVITNFYCARLQDHHEIVPFVIKGLIIIVNSKEIPQNVTKMILKSIFDNVPCQQQQQSDRYNIYCIFKQLHECKREELKEMGLDLIYGIITAIDGEKDPRNLTFLFNWLDGFLNDFELGHLKEEFFEVLACYFPVDFRSISDDGITRDSLAFLLSKCLCSPAFGDFIIPLALEKLDSDLETAKLDSLDILILASNKYPPNLLIKYSTAIWALLHKEILSPPSKAVEIKALKALSSFVKCISNLDNSNDISLNLLRSMIDNVKGNLTPDSKLFEPSLKIILATASASKFASEQIFETVKRLWIDFYETTPILEYKTIVLDGLSDLSLICFENNVEIKKLNEKNNVFEFFLTVLISAGNSNENLNLKLKSLKCFEKNVRFCLESVRKKLFEHFKVLLNDDSFMDVEDSILLSCFKEYSRFYPDEIKGVIVSLKNGNVDVYLNVLGCVLNIKGLREVSVKELCCFTFENDKKEVFKAGFDIFKKALEENENKLDNNEFEVYLNQINFPLKLTNWFLNKYLNNYSKELKENQIDIDLFDSLWMILFKIISRLNKNEQITVSCEIFQSIRLKPIDVVFIIYFGVIIGLKDFEIISMKEENFDENFYKNIVNVAFQTENNYVNKILSKLIGNILNKSKNGYVSSLIRSEIDLNIKKYLKSNLFNSINVLSYFLKGLVLKMDYENISEFITILFELCGDNKETCKCFEIILDESISGFNEFCYINKRLLYKQKFFLEILKRLEKNPKISENINYLTISVYLCLGIPENLLNLHLNSVMRWNILFLNQSEDNLTINRLVILINRFLKGRNENVLRFKKELLKIYLKLASTNQSMKVRIETLKGIRTFTEVLPIYEIINEKQDVLAALNVCVDDRKRLVRKEAMETRLKWFLIDSPT